MAAGRADDIDRFRRLDGAFRTGDMDALRALLGDDDRFPDVIAHPAIGPCLTARVPRQDRGRPRRGPRRPSAGGDIRTFVHKA